MATKKACPNCGNTTKDVSLCQCKNCGFIGCYRGRILSSSGCWQKIECPRCGSSTGSDQFGYIGNYDSN